MRQFTIITVFLLWLACSSKDTPGELENDIFIVELDKRFDKNNNLIDGHRTDESIRFSKNFWKFFAKYFPRSSALIFLSPEYDAHNDYLNLGDTTLTFFNVDFMKKVFFKNLLPTDPATKENSGFAGGFFVMPHDTAGNTDPNDTRDRRPEDYYLSNSIRKEYKTLQNLLTDEITRKHYIIVFKKDLYSRYFPN